MFGDPQDVFDIFRSLPSPVYILVVVPLLLMATPISPVYGMHEFPVFRMQQFDLHGNFYGSRSAVVNLEARPFSADSLSRRCAVTKLKDLSLNKLKNAVDEGLSALLILIPKDLRNIPQDELAYYQQVEVELLDTSFPIPIYFAHDDDKMVDLYSQVSASVTSDSAGSAVEALKTVASANAFHLVSTTSESKAITDFQIASIQGKLSGQGLEDHLPTIAIVTHYDSFGLVPSLSSGSDSNGSGVAAFLEIARLFSKLYERSESHPKFNVLFYLAGGGKFNFQGTKRWIDENLDSTELSLLSEAEFVLCLDSLGQGDSLNLHVSKPPKEGTQLYQLSQSLKQVAAELYPEVNTSIIHKKVNLAEDMLPWEHERFSLRRLPAATLTHFTKPRIETRGSIFDQSVDVNVLLRNTKIIVEALGRHIFNITNQEHSKMVLFGDDLEPDVEFMESWLHQMSQQPTSAQLITKNHKLITGFEQTMSRFLKEVKVLLTKPDKKDPDYLFYDVFETKMAIYSVKPAIFDLLLGIGIVSYLGVIYLIIENFHLFTEVLQKPTTSNGKIH